MQIYDKFEFMDSTIKNNKKYKYQVSIVNNEGLESAKSEAVYN
jgi:fibronectin type 3 domain-containing protein